MLQAQDASGGVKKRSTRDEKNMGPAREPHWFVNAVLADRCGRFQPLLCSATHWA
jgi:hypothetical protein